MYSYKYIYDKVMLTIMKSIKNILCIVLPNLENIMSYSLSIEVNTGTILLNKLPKYFIIVFQFQYLVFLLL